jgi:hypothetical protein
MRLVIFTLLISVSGLAQSSQPDSVLIKNKKLKYFFSLQTASLIGCDDCGKGKEITFSGAIIQGVRIKKFGFGIGLGHDSYHDWNTAPVFLSASWDMIKQKNALVLKVDYGTSLKTWRYYPYENPEYGYKETSGGSTFNPSLGYRVNSDKMHVTFGLGFKTQTIRDLYEFPSWRWTGTQYVEGDPSRRTLKHDLSRLMLSLAVGWN